VAAEKIPAVGQVWIADLRGKVRFASDLSREADTLDVRGPVYLNWESKDKRVFEGVAWHKRMIEEVTLARNHLIAPAPESVVEKVPPQARYMGKGRV
jgi:hypothetical protein